MSKELKACPCCGGDAELINAPVFGPSQWVKCKSCGMATEYLATPSQAIKAWNTRNSHDQLVAALKNLACDYTVCSGKRDRIKKILKDAGEEEKK